MEDSRHCLLPVTHSGSRYRLLLADINLDEFEGTQECLQQFHVPALSYGECEKLAETAEAVQRERVEGSQAVGIENVGDIDVQFMGSRDLICRKGEITCPRKACKLWMGYTDWRNISGR